MATLKIVVLKHQEKEDGTFNVKIRVTNNRQTAYIATSYFATKKQFDKEYKIKDEDLLFEIEGDVRKYRRKLNILGETAKQYTAKDLVEYLTKEQSDNNERIDFLLFLKNFYEDMKKTRKGSHWENFRAMYNHLNAFSKGRLSFRDMTSHNLSEFERYLIKKGVGGRGINLYMTCIRTVFNEGRRQYNDEDYGIIKIANYPFSKYSIPRIPESEIKASGIEVVELLYSYVPKKELEVFTKDMFFLSFYLVGMNARDIFTCRSKIRNNRIEYNRSKTEGQRSDAALISVRVEDEVKELVDKYKDKKGKFLFDIYTRYTAPNNFNDALSNGFISIRENLKTEIKKEVYEELNLNNLTMYSARHSWATIASHNCGIGDSFISKCLNHSPIKEVKMTNKYIKKDWSLIDKCNRQVLDFVKSMIEKKEGEE